MYKNWIIVEKTGLASNSTIRFVKDTIGKFGARNNLFGWTESTSRYYFYDLEGKPVAKLCKYTRKFM